MSDLPSLLPPSASSLGGAIEKVMAERTIGIEAPISTLWNVDTCPVSLLPWMAWAFSVDLWESDWPEQVKRDVIRESIAVHRLKGTAGAVRRALAAVYDDAELREWFETGGDPHTFRASISGEVRGATSLATALGIIERTKPVRSHLDVIEVATPSENVLRIGGAVGARLTQEIDADFPRTTLAHVAGAAVAMRMTQEVSAHG